jgi:hypothetical protein
MQGSVDSDVLSGVPEGTTVLPTERNSAEYWDAQRQRLSYVMVVTYDGTDFSGFQVQTGKPKERTVAAALTRMLCMLLQVEEASLGMTVRSSLAVGMSPCTAPLHRALAWHHVKNVCACTGVRKDRQRGTCEEAVCAVFRGSDASGDRAPAPAHEFAAPI